MSVLVVDPGKQHAGLAFFANTTLTACAYVEGEDDVEVVAKVRQFLADLGFGGVTLLVTENQQVYARGKGDPNDLLPLSRVVGGVRSAIPHQQRALPLPRQWTNGVPKTARQKRFLGRLPPAEKAILEAVTKKLKAEERHDVVDAVHLGVWVLEERRERAKPT